MDKFYAQDACITANEVHLKKPEYDEFLKVCYSEIKQEAKKGNYNTVLKFNLTMWDPRVIIVGLGVLRDEGYVVKSRIAKNGAFRDKMGVLTVSVDWTYGL